MFKLKRNIKDAKKLYQTVVFPEAGFSDRIVNAGKFLSKKKIAKVIFIGDESAFILKYKKLNGITIINPKTSDITSDIAKEILILRKDKDMTEKKANELALDPIYFSTMLVKTGVADVMICGAEVSTSNSLKPALQLIKSKDQSGFVASCNILYGKNKAFGGKSTIVFADCGLNINPTSEQLAIIAQKSADVARNIAHINPHVAFLSFSTKGSAESSEVKKVQKAVQILKEKNVDFDFDGELQIDSAICKSVRDIKAPDCALKENANVFIFPDITSANISYKLVQYVGGMKNVGPIVIGLDKQVNDLSRGATVEDIIALTAVSINQNKKN